MSSRNRNMDDADRRDRTPERGPVTNPQPAAGRWFDAHLHVDLYPEQEREPLLSEAFSGGTAGVVAVSMHLESSRLNQTLAGRFPGRVLPAYGFHPEQPLPDDASIQELLRWIRVRFASGERLAIGEVGLPYYTRTEAEAAGKPFAQEPYIALLEKFVRLASDMQLPIVLHAVYEDADTTLDLLERHHVRKAHFHWFKGSPDTIERMIAAGYYISITPDVLYEEEIQQLVKQYPLELMMTETDGPWPFEGPFAGERTEPLMVRHVAGKIAELKGIPEDAAEWRLYRNAASFYGFSTEG
ncbi:TatD family hydrolase [Paenibacillus spongiae]|uniref:TatD family hydrolase n=1 Tax=Paenibacillus spongiae TaxID=2909671 RepID=A0ABY5SIW6_9BACL|nr:TatD family hydrolase [Paenibacillus spongiae]UVI32445.1 TatD family hydrolase [Paenibacillus spongiae]